MYIVVPIVIGLLVIILVYAYIIRPLLVKKEINKKIDLFIEKEGFTNGKNNSLYDRLIIKDGKKVYFKYVLVPANSQITINCQEIWKLSWGGNPEKKGRAYPNSRYLKEVEDFAKAKMDGTKIFIIYYTTEHILRYINECELETIDITKKTYDYKVICYDRFDEEIGYCINK